MSDRVEAIVHLNHLWHNYQILQKIHHEKQVMAVVKADAYGHGAKEVGQFLSQKGCQYFAVTELFEAIELRKAGIEDLILILGKTTIEHIPMIHEYHLVQTIDSLDYAKQINDLNIPIDVHMIIDTAMSRFGIYCHQEKDLDQTIDEVVQINQLPNLTITGFYTHFACADETDGQLTLKQFHLFQTLIERLEGKGLNLGIKHCSNSASTIKFPNHSLDMVRCGIALYGYPPVQTNEPFLPVMEVKAKVIALRQVLPGDGVSYGHTYKADRPRMIASIGIGYADGYQRLFSNQDYFVFNQKHLPVVGRVCMGVTMVDATDVNLSVGDQVEVFGLNKSLNLMAKTVQTITYELLTNMSKKRICFQYLES